MKQKIIISTVIALVLSSQFVSAGSISDTYTAGDTLTAAKMDNIKTAVNGNAVDVSTNAANIDINANNTSSNTTKINALEGTGTSGVVGTQVINFTESVVIDSTADKPLLNITVPNSGSVDVALNAHLYIEKGTGATGRYQFSIRSSSCVGTTVGLTMWRPDTQAESNVATTIALTGFDSIAASTAYYLCARKFDSVAVNATVYTRGLNAIYK